MSGLQDLKSAIPVEAIVEQNSIATATSVFQVIHESTSHQSVQDAHPLDTKLSIQHLQSQHRMNLKSQTLQHDFSIARECSSVIFEAFAK